VKTPSSSESIYLNWLICREISLRHVDGLCEPKSHAVHNPHTIDPEIERRIIALRREHPDCGKKRIARKGERLQVWVCE